MDDSKIPLGKHAQHAHAQHPAAEGEGTAPSFASRPFRIVIVDDEEGPRKSCEIILRNTSTVKDAILLVFDNPLDAWEELCQTDPDLLITDAYMPELGGRELCQCLLDKKVRYPIIVLASWGGAWVPEFASRGLNISFLQTPFRIDEFRRAVEAALQLSPARTSK